MVLPVLVVELELRTSHFLKNLLGGIKLCDGLKTVRAVVIRAFMDCHFFLDFSSGTEPDRSKGRTVSISSGS